MARYGEPCKNGAPYVECGQYWGGEKQLCAPCQAEAERRYPQGWRGYPGDICKHGVYVGGCGEDLMCGACEAGDTMYDEAELIDDEDDEVAPPAAENWGLTLEGR